MNIIKCTNNTRRNNEITINRELNKLFKKNSACIQAKIL
jgi:hypothetical protein